MGSGGSKVTQWPEMPMMVSPWRDYDHHAFAENLWSLEHSGTPG
jgi:hypothetical protein